MIPDYNNKKDGHKYKSARANTLKVMPFNDSCDGWYCVVVVDKLVNLNLSFINYHIPTPITTLDTTITNTSARGLYLSADSPHSDNNPSAPSIILGTITGQIQNLRPRVGLSPPNCHIICATGTYSQPLITQCLESAAFVMLISRSSSPNILSLSLTLPERPYSQGDVKSTVRYCGDSLYTLGCMTYHSVLPVLPPSG